jgi:hypothetical protein
VAPDKRKKGVTGLPSVKFSKRRKLPDSPGIYFFIDNESIFYIGQSINIKKRCSGHRHIAKLCGTKELRIAYLEVWGGHETRKAKEYEFIKRFSPSLNYQINRLGIKTEVIPFRLTEDELSIITDRVRQTGMPRSVWIRNAVLSHLKRRSPWYGIRQWWAIRKLKL